ncbi:ferritin-like domain-containing protein [Botrimarina sp.]|uniref:YciE/YciF ferroxidase family protein n=1 Tax=Botrimarina sp. TaxID=2795802 RepID=UPI0032EEA2D7
MGLFTSKKFETLDELLAAQIKDLYDAEHRLTEALPKMAKTAKNPELRTAFNNHLKETESQINRLEKVFSSLGVEPERESCDAMKGLISEGEEFIDADGDPDVIDAGLIAAAQRVEHYEIAGYGSARALAKQLGKQQAVSLLQETLDEEGAADKKLTEIAESYVNTAAGQA